MPAFGELRDAALGLNLDDVLGQAIGHAWRHGHGRHVCEQALYRWSVSKDARIQHVVVNTCADMIYGPRRDIALIRLRRTADHASTPQVIEAVAAVFAEAARQSESRVWFRQKAASWTAASSPSRAAALALTAQLRCDGDSGKYRPEEVIHTLMAEPADIAQVVDAVVAYLTAISDPERREIALTSVENEFRRDMKSAVAAALSTGLHAVPYSEGVSTAEELNRRLLGRFRNYPTLGPAV